MPLSAEERRERHRIYEAGWRGRNLHRVYLCGLRLRRGSIKYSILQKCGGWVAWKMHEKKKALAMRQNHWRGEEKAICTRMVDAAIETKDDPESLFHDPNFIQDYIGQSCPRLVKLAENRRKDRMKQYSRFMATLPKV